MGNSPAVAAVHEIEDAVTVSPSPGRLIQARLSDSVSSDHLDIISSKKVSDTEAIESPVLQFVPSIRSGVFADIGPRRYMEDEHIRIDDLSVQLGSVFKFPKPSAFYGVFDGHGGPEAAAYIRKNAMRIFFEDANFPQSSEVDSVFLEEVENSLRKAFHLADLALAEDCNVNTSSGTTAITAFVFGRYKSGCDDGHGCDVGQSHAL
ncbi:hypothetical protein OIU77_010623 [Salix suchowensis]|uniref:protein-serine/threonine phosphatase n=1 Tax=Salix suchowensis TaxID=1278906 RepID=A0ABQ9AA17_9ROSI|nr:hypothetical protein OIU77_010623 [Salix suchowensis]